MPAEQRGVWAERLDAVDRLRPSDFSNNGWVVEALHAAWCAIARTPYSVPGEDPKAGVSRTDLLRMSLEIAVRGGRDADTVAAIVGGLVGAAFGASAVPADWRSAVRGWPGYNATDLIRLGCEIAARR